MLESEQVLAGGGSAIALGVFVYILNECRKKRPCTLSVRQTPSGRTMVDFELGYNNASRQNISSISEEEAETGIDAQERTQATN